LQISPSCDIFLKLKIDKGELKINITEIEDILLNPICLKGSVSRTYDNNCTSALLGLKEVLEKEIGQTFEDNELNCCM